jgi:hypothetical protein
VGCRVPVIVQGIVTNQDTTNAALLIGIHLHELVFESARGWLLFKVVSDFAPLGGIGDLGYLNLL